MKIIFMGTPEFAVPALKTLINDTKHEVVAVFTAPPKPKGRGLDILPSPVQIIANSFSISVYTPKTLRSQETIDLINSINADIIVVIAYGFILPKEILIAKKYGCLNIHPSKLPRYRGAAPLQRTIINGDRETAVCIMQMDEGLDTGDILIKQDIALPDNITLPQLHDICATIGAKLLTDTLNQIDSLPKIKQSENDVVYAEKLKKEEGRIDWSESSFKIDCKIRGMNPWPGVYFEHNGVLIKVLEAVKNDISQSSCPPATVLNEEFEVVCGSGGTIKLTKLKPSGKNEMSGRDYLNGLRDIAYPFKI